MDEVISSADLRHRAGECVARAARGETFVVLRYGRPVAVLRPHEAGERFEELRATALWRDFRRVLTKASRHGVLITWYSDAVAVLGPVPAEWRREVEP